MVEMLDVVASPDSIVRLVDDKVMAHRPAFAVETAVLEVCIQFAGYLPFQIYDLLAFTPDLTMELLPQS